MTPRTLAVVAKLTLNAALRCCVRAPLFAAQHARVVQHLLLLHARLHALAAWHGRVELALRLVVPAVHTVRRSDRVCAERRLLARRDDKAGRLVAAGAVRATTPVPNPARGQKSRAHAHCG